MEIILLKAISVVLLVLMITFVAEYISVKASGIISGMPVGSLITYMFFGLEFGGSYIQDSALFNVLGLFSNISFCIGYYIGTFYKGRLGMVVSIVLSTIFYIIPAMFLINIKPSFSVIFYVLPISYLTIFALIRFGDYHIAKVEKLTFKNLILRILLTICIFLVISSLPNFTTVKTAGFFSSFPIVLLPFVLIIHFNYGNFQARTIVKNAPLGQPAVVGFSLSVYFTINTFGIILALLMSSLVSIFIVLIQLKVINFIKPKK